MKKNNVHPALGVVKELQYHIAAYCDKRGNSPTRKIGELTDFAVPYAVDALFKNAGIKRGATLSKQFERQLLATAYDHAIGTVVAEQWQYSKQVFKFPKIFYQMISDMEDFELEWSIFEQLPYRTFYLEVEDDENIEGIFVLYEAETPSIGYLLIFKHGLNGGIIDPRRDKSFNNFFQAEVELSKADPNSPNVILVRKALIFTIQACMYLCATNADISENEKQKQIYRPYKQPKNRYSEIRMWDVGTRVIKEHREAVRSAEEYLRRETAAGRKRPRQHWRKAHWHTYWTGKGRKKRVVKFIAPVLVNNIGDELPVVIHT